MSRINHIGYACMNLDTSPSSFRTCRIQNLSEDLHRELIFHNLGVLEAMIDYNVLHEVKRYRISSSLIPFASSKACTLDWRREFRGRLEQIGEKIRSAGIYISVHPGQYTVLNSPKSEVVRASVREVEYHADLLRYLQADESGKIILHVGGEYRDKESAMRRFVENYQQLPSEIKKCLTIENDDKIFSVEDVLRISQMTGTPVIYDNLHHQVLPSMGGFSECEILEKVLATWVNKGRPKMHYSQQAPEKSPGSHSSTIDLTKFAEDYQKSYRHFDIDIMLEVKDKNRSFKKADLYLHPSVRKFQEEWARYKYLVMSKSYEDYRKIRRLFKNGNFPSAEDFYRHIDLSLNKASSLTNEINALEHMWGYLKHQAEQKEKQLFFKKMEQFKAGQISSGVMKRKLYELAQKYEETYLLSSYIFGEYR